MVYDLNKTKIEINNYNLPFEPIKPFEPYNLENFKKIYLYVQVIIYLLIIIK